jgi:hypothetical protein
LNLSKKSLSSQPFVAGKIIKSLCIKKSTSLSLPTGGKPLTVHVGNLAKQTFSMTTEQIHTMQASQRWSDRETHRTLSIIKSAVKQNGLNSDLPGKKPLRSSIAAKVEDLYTETLNLCNTGTEKNPKLKIIPIVWCTDVCELCRRVVSHRRTILDVVKIEGDHGQGVLKLSAQFTFSNSVSTMSILAATEHSGESILTLSTMLTLVDPFQLIVRLGAKLMIAGDIKFMQLTISIKTGNCQYPCIWCNWRMTGPLRDPVDQICSPRDLKKDVNEFERLGSNRNKSPKCHGQQGLPSAALLLQFTSVIFVPAVLHINLGLINMIVDAAEEEHGKETVQMELLSIARVSRSDYKGHEFEGNECRRITHTAAKATWDKDHPLFGLKYLFDVFNQVQEHVFSARTDLTDDDLQYIALLIQETVMVWHKTSQKYQLSDPVKLHIFSVHVLEFCKLYRATPGAFSEQDGESMHRVFKETLRHCRTQADKALLCTVTRFTAFNFS